jgi:dipeptidyl aminopeptidase/acylaminoacyl peptidase
MVTSCIVLIGVSYLMLNILSGIVITPKTPVKEYADSGELILPLYDGAEVSSMQVSMDGRFLAYIEYGGEGTGESLKVVELTGDRSELISLDIMGENLAWLGSGSSLAYENSGDIYVLDMAEGEPVNLTASEENDYGPIPSPDGRYILWTRSSSTQEDLEPDLWVMEANGGNQVLLADYQSLPTWDPAGGKVMSRRDTTLTDSGDSYRHSLFVAVPGGIGWEFYAECEGEVRFIWWPDQDAVLYVSPLSVKGEDKERGVWIRAERPNKLKKVASTKGLGFDETYYNFFPSRRGELLAYVGELGLEYLDYEERIIYRYPSLEARTPLAWNETAGELLYIGPEGIYSVVLEGG